MPVLEQAAPRSRISVPGNKGIKLHRSIVIRRPVHECYRFFRNFENLPRFMEHVVSVSRTSDKHSHWTVKAPMGRTVEWDAEVINEHENSLIAWRTVEHADVSHAGSVRFHSLADGTETEMVVSLEYLPPGGRLGAWVAKLFGEEPEMQIVEDLRRFKSLLERGEGTIELSQPIPSQSIQSESIQSKSESIESKSSQGEIVGQVGEQKKVFSPEEKPKLPSEGL